MADNPKDTIVRDWINKGATPEERAKRENHLGTFHSSVLIAADHARRNKVPDHVIERILRGLGGHKA